MESAQKKHENVTTFTKSGLRMIWTIAGAIAAMYLITGAYMYIFQSGFLFFPDRQIVMTPRDIGLEYQPVKLIAEDGVNLAAWFVPAETSRGAVIFCHGNAGNISHRLETVRLLNHLGLDLLIFDYRGYGESDGVPTEAGLYMDGTAAWRYLTETRQIDPEDITIFGKSLGGAVATWLAQNNRPRSLIIESTFTSVPDVAAKAYPIFPVRLLTRYKFPTVEYIRNVTCPVLVIHSKDDEMIPFKLGRQLFDAANEPKQFLELKGSHNDAFIHAARVYEKGLTSFLASEVNSRDGG